LDVPLPAANADLANHNDDLVKRYLGRMNGGTVVDRVRVALGERLASDPSPSEIAAALGMSARSLQRRLQEPGTTYAPLFDETRRGLACRHLRDEGYSVTEIAFILGFDDASSFARAFRRWTGRSPSEYRANPAPSPQNRA